MHDVTDLSDRRPSLRRGLLVNVVVLGAAALSIAVAAALAAELVPASFAVPALIFLVVGDLAIVIAYGRYLTDRLVGRPLDALRRAAEELAQGNLASPAPAAHTLDVAALADPSN